MSSESLVRKFSSTQTFISYVKFFLHWARVVGYGPFSLCVIHKEACAWDINKLMMMMMMINKIWAVRANLHLLKNLYISLFECVSEEHLKCLCYRFGVKAIVICMYVCKKGTGLKHNVYFIRLRWHVVIIKERGSWSRGAACPNSKCVKQTVSTRCFAF
jgi:hypothetical protein